jgi:hypothetical protein
LTYGGPTNAQRVQAHGPLLLHHRQQAVADQCQAAVAEVTELRLIHANRLLPVDCPERISLPRCWEGGWRRIDAGDAARNARQAGDDC